MSEICTEEAVYFLMSSERKEDSNGMKWFRDGKMVAEVVGNKIDLTIEDRKQSFENDDFSTLINLGITKNELKFAQAQPGSAP